MRILHVHTRYRERGGEDSVVDQERRLLSESGVEVVPLDFHNPSGPVESVATLMRAPWNRSASSQVLATAREHSVDLVHVHNTWFALSPALVPILTREGFPVVMTFHNYRLVCVNAMLFREGAPCELCVGRSPVSGVRYRCYRNSASASAMVALTIQTHRWKRTWVDHLSAALVLTEFARARLLQGGLPAERTVVKPNFVADPGPRMSRPSDSTEVLYVGRLSAEKGVRLLLDAWRRADLGGLDLLVVGTGPEENLLRELCGPDVRLVGRLAAQEVSEKMLSARALVVPSLWYEGMPMVILEALASGLPIFHTDVGALGETVGRGGVAIGSGDIDEMAGGLARLTDTATLDRVGGLGRLEFESRFSEACSLGILGDAYAIAVDKS